MLRLLVLPSIEALGVPVVLLDLVYLEGLMRFAEHGIRISNVTHPDPTRPHLLSMAVHADHLPSRAVLAPEYEVTSDGKVLLKGLVWNRNQAADLLRDLATDHPRRDELISLAMLLEFYTDRPLLGNEPQKMVAEYKAARRLYEECGGEPSRIKIPKVSKP
jgi:hypothetical protein